MSRISKALLLVFVVVFLLACNFVTQPIQDAQEAVETVQSIATAMPLETLQAFATSVPFETLVSVPSSLPDIDIITDPQGAPLTEWRGIPVMPGATAGQETSEVYSYTTNATVQEVYDYYKAEMASQGWSEFFSVPDTGSGALLSYEKDSSIATITIATGDGSETLVLITSQ